jgi:ribonuclease HI
LAKSIFIDEENKERSWGLDFYGVHSSSGSGVGIVLRSPDNETTLFSYRLEFNCTKNIVEYEALILGMNLAIDMNLKSLHVRGDSDLIVLWVIKNFATKCWACVIFFARLALVSATLCRTRRVL